MRVRTRVVRPPGRQVPLFPLDERNEEINVADATPELVEALADLLLEALGNREGGGDEPEDHA